MPDLDRLLPGAWHAVMRNQHGPFHLEGVLNSDKTLTGWVIWPQAGSRIPAGGSWSAQASELSLEVTQNNLEAKYYWRPARESWALKCHFTAISWNTLSGFTLPDLNDPAATRYDCTWTRLS